MLIGQYNKSLIISYLGVAFAVSGMVIAAHANYKLAVICLILAGVCDMFDGKIARMFKRSKDEELFGIQLDSLADTIDFLAFPIVLGLSLGFNDWYNTVSYILLAMCGIQRLCHFNVLVMNKNDKGPVKFYSGLPVTSTSITYPLFFLVSYFISYSAYHVIYTILTFVTAILFVLNIKVPKPRGVAYPIIAVIALVAIIMICVL